jgi:hypothetical protein
MPPQEVIGVQIDGQWLTPDVDPVIIEDRTLVPLRFVAEAFGLQPEWHSATRTAMLTAGDFEIRITIGETTAYVDGNPLVLDVPATIISERTMVPLRFISEAFGANVEWDSENRNAIITNPAN